MFNFKKTKYDCRGSYCNRICNILNQIIILKMKLFKLLLQELQEHLNIGSSFLGLLLTMLCISFSQLK